MSRIKQDHSRFRQIVRGKIRQNLKKYISRGELIGKQGKDVVSIPLPQIDTPRFKYDPKDTGGTGQGDGKPGDSLGPGNQQPGQGKEKAGEGEGEKSVEVDVTLDELAEILGEELQLPRIEPKGQKQVVTERDRYTGIRPVGPDSLRHFKRTFKQALKRTVATGQYNPENPIVVPIRHDMRYRTWNTISSPQSNAVVIYMMDVSGSMGDEQKEIVRIESFWINTWLRSQYKGIATRYIVHDATAREVDEHTFFHTRESGGTMISSAYKLCAQIIKDEYPSADWNIYPFHFSDGDNWSVDDTAACVRILKEDVVPASNQFSYGQVESPYGSGQFIKDLREHFKTAEGDCKVVVSEIKDKEAIIRSIKDFLGAGR
jgi:sporulation protein YhbH